MSGAAALRRMRWWDVDPLLDVERSLFGREAWSAETFWSELAAPGRTYLVAHAPDGEVLGYAGVAAGASEADVQTIAVLPAAQGGGVGRLLLAALVDAAVAAGSTALLLEVRADNSRARDLYARNGFEQIAVRRRYYQPDDVDAVIMRRRPLAMA